MRHQPPNFPSHPIFALLKKHTTQNGVKKKREEVVNDHNPYDVNPFSSPVFSSFRPHHFYSILIHFLVWYGGKKRADEDGEKSVDEK